MSADVEIDSWLKSLGYGLPASLARARTVLEAAGVTRASKQRMSVEKESKAQQVLSEALVLHCSTAECVGWARAQAGREATPCDPKNTCARCGGSDNARAVSELLEACRRAKVRKLLIVGGSPNVREELERLIGTALELRLVDGTERRTADRARADIDWADVMLIWGASELHHKVSTHYTAAGPGKSKMVHVTKRGIAQLLAAAVEHLKRL